MRTLAIHDESRNNNFTILRLISAIYVILHHSWTMLSNPLDPIEKILPTNYIPGNIGVLCFFTISGFLITESYLRNHNALYFIRARVLRIFPGLACSLLVTALIIGPLVTTLPLAKYYSSVETYSYIYGNLSLKFMQKDLPGVLNQSNINVSLWTLPLEFRLYLIIFIAGIVGALKNPKIGIIVLLLCYSAFAFKFYLQPKDVLYPFTAVCCFAIGSLFYFMRHRVILSYYILIMIILLSILTPLKYQSIFSVLTVSYLTFLLAYSKKFSFSALDSYGDFSYGLYIYAVPIQLVQIYFNPQIGPIELFFKSLIITLFLAVCSWFFIEKPSLSLKKKTSLSPIVDL